MPTHRRRQFLKSSTSSKHLLGNDSNAAGEEAGGYGSGNNNNDRTNRQKYMMDSSSSESGSLSVGSASHMSSHSSGSNNSCWSAALGSNKSATTPVTSTATTTSKKTKLPMLPPRRDRTIYHSSKKAAMWQKHRSNSFGSNTSSGKNSYNSLNDDEGEGDKSGSDNTMHRSPNVFLVSQSDTTASTSRLTTPSTADGTTELILPPSPPNSSHSTNVISNTYLSKTLLEKITKNRMYQDSRDQPVSDSSIPNDGNLGTKLFDNNTEFPVHSGLTNNSIKNTKLEKNTTSKLLFHDSGDSDHFQPQKTTPQVPLSRLSPFSLPDNPNNISNKTDPIPYNQYLSSTSTSETSRRKITPSSSSAPKSDTKKEKSNDIKNHPTNLGNSTFITPESSQETYPSNDNSDSNNNYLPTQMLLPALDTDSVSSSKASSKASSKTSSKASSRQRALNDSSDPVINFSGSVSSRSTNSTSSTSSSSSCEVWYREKVQEYTDIASTCMESKQYQDACKNFHLILKLHKVQHGPMHTTVASTHHNIGIVYTHLQDRTKALDHFRKAAHVGRHAWGSDHLHVALSLVRIGFLLLQQNDPKSTSKKVSDDDMERALITFKEVLRIRLLHTQDAVLIAKAYRYVAMSYALMHQHSKARVCLRKARAIAVENQKESQLESAASWVQEGQMDNSKDCFQKAFVLYTKYLGKDNEVTIQAGAWYQYCKDQEDTQKSSNQWFSPQQFPTESTLELPEKEQNQENELLSVVDERNDNDNQLTIVTKPSKESVGTSIWVSPHFIPQQANSPNAASIVSELTSTTLQGQTAEAQETKSNTKKQQKQVSGKLVDSSDYEGEESCMISTHGQVEGRDEGHSIMVVRPDDESMSCDEEGIVIPKILQKGTVNNNEPLSNNDRGNQQYDDEFEDEEGLFPPPSSGANTQNGISIMQMLQSPQQHVQELHNAASRYVKQNKLDQALELFTILLETYLEMYGELHETIGATYHNLGIVYLRKEDLEKALSCFERAVWKRQGSMGRNHCTVAVSLVKVGIVLLLMHRLDEALHTFQQALHIRRQALGHLHPSIARIYNNIGCVHVEFQEMRQARRAFEASLDIQRSALVDKPQNGPLLFGVATTLCNLGFLYTQRSMFAKAQIVFAEAVTFQQSVLGKHHKTVLSTKDSLADACAKNKQPSEALRYYKEILAELKSGIQCERKAKACAVILYKISRLHRVQNDAEATLRSLRLAQKYFQKVHDKKHDNVRTRIELEIVATQRALTENDLTWV